jgi:hypothetical protein
VIVQVADVTTQIQTPVPVVTSATTSGVDIYVPPPAGILNATTIGVLVGGQALLSQSSAELPRGQGTTLMIAGNGISQSNGTTLSISGTGTTISNVSYQVSGSSTLIVATVTVNGAANPGPRNVILTNSNGDVSVLTGGVIIR